MAPQETTTLRIPIGLRKAIARIADQRGTTMVEVVSEAVHRLGHDQWWAEVHQALDAMTESERLGYQGGVEALDGAGGDGLGG